MCRHNEGGPAAANFHVCFLPSAELATHVASQQQRRRVKVQQMQQMQDEAAAQHQWESWALRGGVQIQQVPGGDTFEVANG